MDDMTRPSEPNAADRRALLARLLAERQGSGVMQVHPEPLLLLRKAMEKHATAVAVVDGVRRLRFSELATEAGALAVRLRDQGAEPGTCVGVALERSVDLVIAVVAVLETGAAILPLDPSDGADRIETMIAANGPVAIVGEDRQVEAKQPSLTGPTGLICRLHPDRSAILVDAATVASRLAWLNTLAPLHPGDRVGFGHTLHGGALTIELLWPLCRGATVVPRGSAPAAELDVLHVSVYEAARLPARARRLRLILVSGDRMEGAVVRRLRSEVADDAVALFVAPAVCGPVAFHRCSAETPDGPVPMGQAAGLRLTVRDHRGAEVPAGVPGLLCLGDGTSLGQRVRRRPVDGLLEWLDPGLLGGMPVSPGSITAALLAQPGVADAHVRIARDADGCVVANAYVVPATGAELPQGLADRLARVLPPWSRPAAMVAVSMIPLSEQGVDEAALDAVPLLDAGVAAELEARLTAAAGIEETAVVMQPARFETRPIPLPVRAPLPAAREPTRQRIAHADPPPAHADGGPLGLPTDAPTTLVAALERTAREAPERGLSIIDRDRATSRLSYADLRRHAARVAAGLRAAGIAAGDPVMLQIADHRNWALGFWGAVLAGAQPVTVAVGPTFDPQSPTVQKLLAAHALLGRPLVLTTGDLASGLSGLGIPRLALVAALCAEEREIQPDPAGRDVSGGVLFLQLSSGSTGTSKCIQITHRGVVAHIHGALAQGAILCGGDEVGLNWLPMDHVVPVMTHLRDVYLGQDQVQIDTNVVLADPLVWLRAIETHRATHIWSPNFGYTLVADAMRRAPAARFDLSSVRRAMNAGEQVTLRTTEAFLAATERFGLSRAAIQPAFGMAETCTCMAFQTGFTRDGSVVWLEIAALQQGIAETCPPEDPAATAFMRLGPAVPGAEIRIAGPDGTVLPEGRIGRLQIRGGVVTPGYLHNESANREALVGDGWLDSGDLGFLLGGNLVLTGRAKETIIVNGANYYCHDIEDVAGALDGVSPGYVAATGLPDAGSGSEGLAVTFVPREGADPDAVAAEIRRAVARQVGLRPSLVMPIERAEFPKTTSGKIQRSRIRERLAGMTEERTVPDWFMHEVWLPRPRPVDGGMRGGVAILAEPGSAVASALATACTRAGLPVLADPGRADEAAAVIDARALDAPGSPAQRGAAGIARLLGLVERLEPGTRLAIITQNALATSNAPDPAAACLRPVLRSLTVERPDLDLRQIDVAEPAAVADAILAEVAAPPGTPEAALRGSQRLVPRLRTDLPAGTAGVPLRTGGCYVVTGGCSPVGLALIHHLLEACQGRVLITGRAAPEAREAVLRTLDGLGGAVRYAVADTGDEAAMRAAMEAAARAFGGDFDAAFHLAGTAEPRLLSEETETSLTHSLSAKADGAAVLDRLLRAQGDALRGDPGLVVLSSVNAVFGGAGAGAYGAANAAMAAIARARQDAGLKTAILHCSQWRGLGISERLGLEAFAAARGFLAMPTNEAIASVIAAAAAGGEWLIGLDSANPNIAPRMMTGCRPLMGLAAHVVATPAALASVKGLTIPTRSGTPVPWTLVTHQQLPRLGSGEIDRTALAATGAPGSDDHQAPESRTEQRLAAIWQDLLGRGAVRREDDFFAVGGHSLSAARLMLRIRDTFGVDLPLRVLFDSPTVAGMAAALDARVAARQRPLPTCLMALEEQGEGTPFFCVHPAGGSPLCYASLARAIGQPFLGFQAPGLGDDGPPLPSVEAMAEAYVAAIREVQPEGSYRVGAWSSGGPVAFEIARQLEAAGGTVSLLAMIDCGLLESDNPMRGWGPLWPLRGMVEIGRYLTQIRLPRRYAELRELAQMIGLSLPARARELRPGVVRALVRSLRLFNHHTGIGLAYRPQPYGGRVTLFRASRSAPRGEDPVLADLSRYAAGGVELIPIAGDHMSVVLDPEGNRELAAALAECLRRDGRPDPDKLLYPITSGDRR